MARRKRREVTTAAGYALTLRRSDVGISPSIPRPRTVKPTRIKRREVASADGSFQPFLTSAPLRHSSHSATIAHRDHLPSFRAQPKAKRGNLCLLISVYYIFDKDCRISSHRLSPASRTPPTEDTAGKSEKSSPIFCFFEKRPYICTPKTPPQRSKKRHEATREGQQKHFLEIRYIAGWSSWQLVGLITQRSEVRVLLPLLRRDKVAHRGLISFSYSTARTRTGGSIRRRSERRAKFISAMPSDKEENKHLKGKCAVSPPPATKRDKVAHRGLISFSYNTARTRTEGSIRHRSERGGQPFSAATQAAYHRGDTSAQAFPASARKEETASGQIQRGEESSAPGQGDL